MIEKVTSSHYRLTGCVGISASAALLEMLSSIMPSSRASLDGGELVLDVEGVESADSLLLAIILEAARRVESVGGTLKVLGLSEGLNGLASVYGVDTLINNYRVIT